MGGHHHGARALDPDRAGGLAEFERELIRARTGEGRAATGLSIGTASTCASRARRSHSAALGESPAPTIARACFSRSFRASASGTMDASASTAGSRSSCSRKAWSRTSALNSVSDICMSCWRATFNASNQGRDRAPDFYPASQFRSRFYRPDVIQSTGRSPTAPLATAPASRASRPIATGIGPGAAALRVKGLAPARRA